MAKTQLEAEENYNVARAELTAAESRYEAYRNSPSFKEIAAKLSQYQKEHNDLLYTSLKGEELKKAQDKLNAIRFPLGQQLFASEAPYKLAIDAAQKKVNEAGAEVNKFKTAPSNNQATSKPANTVAVKKAQNKKNDDAKEKPSPEKAGTSANDKQADAVLVEDKRIHNPNRPNKRQFNPLAKFSSVTYQISLYALTPKAYNDYYVNGKWILKDAELIVQSGGINKSTDAARSQASDLDYYIDNLEITSRISQKETRVSTNATVIKFQIFEPYAMTFPSKIIAAAKKLVQTAAANRQIDDMTTALNIPFLLVVRFYGYDNEGNLVVKPVDAESPDYNKTDKTAAFERAWPIIIKNVRFKLDNKTTVYDVDAILLNEQIAFSLKRGIIKSQITVAGDTVINALGGGNTAGGKGLLDQVNAQQIALSMPTDKKQKQLVADEYHVTIEDSSKIKAALIVDKDFYVKQYTPNVDPRSAAAVNARTAYVQGVTVNKQQRQITIPAGSSILGAIDQIISQSTFLRDSMKAFDIENNKPVQENDPQSVETKAKNQFEWYTVRPLVKFKEQFDSKRNDNAYDITYQIKKYKVPYIRSLVIEGKLPYYGPHKIYNYWYSGENSEVLSYEMTYNTGYYNTQIISSEFAQNSGDNAPNSVEPSTQSNPNGMLPGAKELQNAAKTFLYTPGDQKQAVIKILGDPDFLMTSESGSLGEALTSWYGSDFSIDPSGGQVFVEIGFNEVTDYNNTTGLMTPKNNIVFWDYPEEIAFDTQGRMIYMVTEVVSKFSKGTFTQELRSALPSFNDDSKKSSRQGTAATDPERETAYRPDIDGPGVGKDASLAAKSQTYNNPQPIAMNTTTTNAGEVTPPPAQIAGEPTVNDDSLG